MRVEPFAWKCLMSDTGWFKKKCRNRHVQRNFFQNGTHFSKFIELQITAINKLITKSSIWPSCSFRKRLRIHSVISVKYHYRTVLCPLNLLVRFKCYKTVQNKFKQIFINKYILHVTFVNKNERQAIFFIFNTNPRFLPFLLYVRCKSGVTFIRRSFRDVLQRKAYGRQLCWTLIFTLHIFHTCELFARILHSVWRIRTNSSQISNAFITQVWHIRSIRVL